MADQNLTDLAGAKEARRWKKELQLATKREKDWEREADKIVKRYRGEERKRNRYNVLWANTEILRPAIYNSRPNPDVRRRFRDADPAGKAVSEVLERALQVFLDGDEVNDAIQNDVLDGLLPGRGVSRIRYVPKIKVTPKEREENDEEIGEAGSTSIAPADKPDSDTTESAQDSSDRPEGKDDDEDVDLPDEEVESETLELIHVDWKDYRHGYGRTWPEVPWEAFRHKLTRAEAKDKFGEEPALEKIEFTVPVGEEYKKPGEVVGETEKVAEFWEIWDKVGAKVFFTHEDVDSILYPKDNPDGEPPLEFDGFYPNPRPLMLVENTGSLLPTPPFRLYDEQAAELDLISGRINKIVKSMRLRGIYDAKIPEMKDLLSSDDNEMIPIQNAQQWKDGGLDNAVSWFPVEKNAQILEALYDAREKQKAIIDELTGIADIMRGATDPNETLGAQELKSTYGSVRLQRMQKEVQRYACDILRLAAAAMCQKFSPETFTEMTELKFPTSQQKQMLIAGFQRQQAVAAMPAPQPMSIAAAQGTMPPGPAPGLGVQMPPAGGAALGGPPPGAGMSGPALQPQPAAPPIDPMMLKVPTWDDIMAVMHSRKLRQFKIDIETDSTIAGTLSNDMAGLSLVLKAVAETMTELAPMVEQGVLPVDAAKELIMVVIRRSRMGMAVEDAFDKLKAPQPKPDPAVAKAQAQAQGAAAKAQAESQSDMQIAQFKERAEDNRMMIEQHFKSQREQYLEDQKTARDENDARFDAMVKIIVATISATKQPDAAVQPVADRTVAGNASLPQAPLQ